MRTESPLILTVSELNRYVKSKLDADENLDPIFLVGEISNCKYHSSGHLYFTLKDEASQVRAVMFRSAVSRLRFRAEDGMQVLLRGRASLYEAGGSYQVFAEDMQPDGAGALSVAFEQRKQKLAAEGLFDASRKRPLPVFPQTIGVITSGTGAAVQDILQILARRWPAAAVVLAPVAVQGEEAPAQIVEALQAFGKTRCADVLIVGRGGGSAEDLWAFNDERLVRAVAASPIPVISAVGHETDFTLCDFAADLRAPTPSAAAELAVPDRTEQRARLLQTRAYLAAAAADTVAAKRERLALLLSRGSFQKPRLFLDEKRMRLLQALSALQAQEKNTLHGAREQLGSLAAKLHSLSPLAVLARGYTLAAAPGGKTIGSVREIAEGDTLTVRFSDGTADCTVRTVQVFAKE